MTASTELVAEFMPAAGPFDITGDYYLLLEAGSGGNASTPDAAALDITGDIDIRIEITPDTWRPEVHQILAVKDVVAGDQRSWRFVLLTNGWLYFDWSTDGVSRVSRQSLTAMPGNTGRLWVRFTFDVDNGAGGNTATFWTSTDGVSWTQFSVPETQSGTTSIFSSSAPVEIGPQRDLFPATSFGGRVHRFELRDGIDGTVVADPDFTAETRGTTSFADDAGNTWTVNAPGAIIGFDWETVPNRLLDADWTYGRSGPLDRFPPGTCTLVFANEDRELDPEHTGGTWFGELLPRVPFRLLSVSSALDLPGAAGATASTPDRAEFAVIDLDVRVHLAMDDWTPAGFGQFLAGQWPNVGGNNGWVFAVLPAGGLRLTFTTDGSTSLDRDSTVATGFIDGSDHWVRATFDANNGATGHDVAFWTSADGVTWTQLGTTVTTAGTVSLFDSTAALTVGDILPLAGQVRYVEVRDGIDGTIVANPEFTSQDPGAVSFADRAGNTWTVNGTATVAIDTAHRSDEFYGFVEDGWIPDYRPPGMSTVEVPLTDMLGVLAGENMPESVYATEVLADAPQAFWRLDQTAGQQMPDSSGNGNHGFVDNGEQGVDPLIVDGRAFNAPHVGDHRGRFSGESLPVAPPCTLEAWIRTPRDLAALKQIIVAQRDNTFGSGLVLQIERSGEGSPNGELVINFFGISSFYKARGHRRVDDDEPHHVVCTIGTTSADDILLYVDGELQTKTTISGTDGGNWTGHFLWTVGNTADTGQGDFGLDGIIDEVAVYALVLTGEQVAAHYQAGATGFSGEWSGERVDRVLDIVGIPDSLRDLDQGDTTVGPADYAGQSVLDYLSNVTESEQGFLHVAHWDGGKIAYRGRYSRITSDRSANVLWAFTDDDDPGALHYERGGLDIAPNGIAGIVNLVECGWRGGTVTPRDEDSISRFGPRSRRIETEAPTASAAANAGLWLINEYSEPLARVKGFRLRPDADWRLRRPASDLRISDRFSLVRHPLQVGSSVTTELHVEQVSHQFHDGVGRSMAVRCSDAFLGDVWIWGVSEWGVDTTWG